MKIKTILGLIACAGACASYSAFGNTNTNWFEVVASSKTATDVTITTNATTVTIAELVGDGTKIALDNDESTALVFTPSAAPSVSDNVITITAVADLTPSSTNDLDETITDAKAGFAVAYDDDNSTNYYGYACGASPKWVKLSGTPTSGDTTFTLVLDYRTGKQTVTFKVGETLLTKYGDNTVTNFSISGATSLASIAAWGSGSIASIGTECEVAVAAYGGNKYGSIAEASAAAKIVEPSADPSEIVQAVSSDGSTVTANTKADNGLSVVVCEALGLATDDADANIEVKPVVADDDTGNITLAVANIAAAPEGSAVKYKVEGGDEDEYYDNAGAIKIPLKAGTYRITPVLK